jgi:RNA polymerase sigma-70 factor (ECF subfamily)
VKADEGHPVAEQTDQELLCAAQSGDIDAYEMLQARLEPPIRRYVRRMIGGDGFITDDVVQDVFIALYTHLKDINPPEKLRAYVFRIAHNCCMNEFRRWQRENTISLDVEPVQMWVSFTASSNGSRPEELTHWLLLYMEVQEAMSELPDLQREALILFSEENLSYAEIAEIMDCSVGTIKSRLYHAKQTLRRLVRPETLHAIENG